MRSLSLGLLVVLGLAACRADPGIPDYSSHAGIRGRSPAGSEALPGSDPYVPGEPRLSIGLFYEGGYSEQLPLDGVSRHYYIFQIEATGQLTYTQESADDHVEGRSSDALTLEGTPWWGGGVVWDRPTDLSKWRTFAISLQSSDPAFADVDIKMLFGETATQEAKVLASSYGYTNDGEWHGLRIPMQDLVSAGLDQSRVRGPLVLGGVGGTLGETLLVDDVYLE